MNRNIHNSDLGREERIEYFSLQPAEAIGLLGQPTLHLTIALVLIALWKFCSTISQIDWRILET